jgi:hypothetical protein
LQSHGHAQRSSGAGTRAPSRDTTVPAAHTCLFPRLGTLDQYATCVPLFLFANLFAQGVGELFSCYVPLRYILVKSNEYKCLW